MGQFEFLFSRGTSRAWFLSRFLHETHNVFTLLQIIRHSGVYDWRNRELYILAEGLEILVGRQIELVVFDVPLQPRL